MVWRLCVLAAWVAVGVGIAYADPDGGDYIWFSPLLTVAVGVLVDRFWAALTPVAAVLAYLVISAVAEPTCPSCNEEGNIVAIVGVLFMVPAMIAITAGVAARRFFRFMRSMETGADAEPPQAPPRSPPPGPAAP